MSETGGTDLQNVILENERQLALANERFGALTRKFQLMQMVAKGMIGLFIFSVAVAIMFVPTLMNRASQVSLAENARLEAELAQFNSMFQNRTCSVRKFSGAQLVTTNEEIRGGGPVVCKCGGATCIDEDGVVDTSFPFSRTCACANHAWNTYDVPFYNITEEAIAPVHIRCFARPDGRTLKNSCMLYIREIGSSVPKDVHDASYVLEKSLKNAESLLALIMHPFTVALVVFILWKERSNIQPHATDRPETGVPPGKPRTVHVFDIQTNRPVEVEWKDIPRECVRAAVDSTTKWVRLCQNRNHIYHESCENPDQSDPTFYLSDEIWCMDWLESKTNYFGINFLHMKVLHDNDEKIVVHEWTDHLDLVNSIVLRNYSPFVSFHCSSDGRFWRNCKHDSRDRMIFEKNGVVFYSLNLLRAIAKHFNQ